MTLTFVKKTTTRAPVNARNYSEQFSTKYVWKTKTGGEIIETGIYAHPDYKTDVGVEITTQIGCQQRCLMCASGEIRFKRNLTAQEMADQVFEVVKREGVEPDKVSEYFYISVMGIGEPSLNAPAVVGAANLVRGRYPNTHVNISTIGKDPSAIILWADSIDAPLNLALSLHAPNQQLREKIIPGAKGINLETVLRSLDYFHQQHPQGKVWITYTPFMGINDGEENIGQLLEETLYSRRNFVTLKFLMLNQTSCSQQRGLCSPQLETVRQWIEKAQKLGYYKAYLWQAAIDMACGQLILDKVGEE